MTSARFELIWKAAWIVGVAAFALYLTYDWVRSTDEPDNVLRGLNVLFTWTVWGLALAGLIRERRRRNADQPDGDRVVTE